MSTTRSTVKRMPVLLAALGAAMLAAYHAAQAGRAPPEAHAGVSVETLGVVPESSLTAQVGLAGHVMQLREITVAPGGQIARHGHAKRPGLVWTLSGTWTEGRPGGEKEYPANMKQALIEDADTEHWFWNDGTEPVKVVVCDIVPAK